MNKLMLLGLGLFGIGLAMEISEEDEAGHERGDHSTIEHPRCSGSSARNGTRGEGFDIPDSRNYRVNERRV